jgi:hypothetical protein
MGGGTCNETQSSERCIEGHIVGRKKIGKQYVPLDHIPAEGSAEIARKAMKRQPCRELGMKQPTLGNR